MKNKIKTTQFDIMSKRRGVMPPPTQKIENKKRKKLDKLRKDEME